MHPPKKNQIFFFFNASHKCNGQDFQNLIFGPYLLKFLVISRYSSAYLISVIEDFFEKQCKCDLHHRGSEAWETSCQKWPLAMNPLPVIVQLQTSLSSALSLELCYGLGAQCYRQSYFSFGFFSWSREAYSGKREKTRSTTMFKIRGSFHSSKGSNKCNFNFSHSGIILGKICIPFFYLSFASNLLFISALTNGRQNNFISLSKQCLS